MFPHGKLHGCSRGMSETCSRVYPVHGGLVCVAHTSCVSVRVCDTITNPGACPFSPEAYNILWKNKRVQVRKKRS